MLKPEIKRLAIFLILLYVFLIKTGYTDADIFAERVVSRNKFSVMTLDFSTKSSFNNSPVTSLFHSLGIQPNGFDLAAAKVKAETDAKFKYHLRAVKTNGDDFFCSQLQVRVFNRNFLEIFSGSLLNLSFSTANSNPRDFIFFVSLSGQDQALQNKICEFNFDLKTYRDQPDEQGGIFAQRLISNVISSGNW
ncbi:MAG: hypothetical protein WC863_03360 [Patescibacteria group bacterium]